MATVYVGPINIDCVDRPQFARTFIMFSFERLIESAIFEYVRLEAQSTQCSTKPINQLTLVLRHIYPCMQCNAIHLLCCVLVCAPATEHCQWLHIVFACGVEFDSFRLRALLVRLHDINQRAIIANGLIALSFNRCAGSIVRS